MSAHALFHIYSRRLFSGGGVAGLALALTLARNPGCAVELYEAAHSFTDVGAGIGFWPRGWDVLKGIGVFDDLVKKVTAFSGDLQPSTCTVCVDPLCKLMDGYSSDLAFHSRSQQSDYSIL